MYVMVVEQQLIEVRWVVKTYAYRKSHPQELRDQLGLLAIDRERSARCAAAPSTPHCGNR